MKKKPVLIITSILLFLILIQSIKIDKTQKPITSNDYIKMTLPPSEVITILKRSCYDCHSEQVKYPTYANFAPISWYIQSHVYEGKQYFNFSRYGEYNIYQKEYVNRKLVTVIENQSMPLNSYLILHKEAKLSAQDQKILLNWFTYLYQKNHENAQIKKGRYHFNYSTFRFCNPRIFISSNRIY